MKLSVEFDRVIEGGPLKDNKFPYRVWSFYGISFGRWFKVGFTVGRKGREYTEVAVLDPLNAKNGVQPATEGRQRAYPCFKRNLDGSCDNRQEDCAGCKPPETVPMEPECDWKIPGKYCCKIGCNMGAEFEIFQESGNFEDNTMACEAHVGELLMDGVNRVVPLVRS